MRVATCLSGRLPPESRTFGAVFSACDKPCGEYSFTHNLTDIFAASSDFYYPDVYPTGKSIGNMENMFFRIFKANQFKQVFEIQNDLVFDVEFRIRADTKFDVTNPYNLDVKENTVYVPSPDSVSPSIRNRGGVTDLFAYGDSKSMNVYSQAWIELPQYIARLGKSQPHNCYNPELFLYHYLKDRIEIVFINLPITIIRK